MRADLHIHTVYSDGAYTPAEIAARVLLGGEYVGDIPIAYDDTPVKKYNPEICEELGIAVPDGYEPIGG